MEREKLNNRIIPQEPPPPILLYSRVISPRLKYISSFLFSEVLHTSCLLTTDEEKIRNWPGLRINYSNRSIPCDLRIPCAGLLYETDISEKDLRVTHWRGYPAFFALPDADIPFDLLSASFYLLSRYEEYLAYEPDAFQRYPHHQSMAYQLQFLQLPLIDLWILTLKQLLDASGKAYPYREKKAHFIPTYDIDIAYSYRGKGLRRTLGGWIKDLFSGRLNLVQERFLVLLGRKKDPYDCYDALDDWHHTYQLNPLYFILSGAGSELDKNISPFRPVMRNLVQRLRRKYEIGIHPSWESHQHEEILIAEKNHLPAPITKSRQHYIRFALPETYRLLIRQGITDDYSMGYGSINGFRASTSHSFFWYDLRAEQITTLKVHPFCFMECNARFEQKQSTEETKKELAHYLQVIHTTKGQLITIWHNFALGDSREWQGWPELYQWWLASVHQLMA